jgi:hypothetical protein
MSPKLTLAALAGAVFSCTGAHAQDVPRHQNRMVENPNGTIANPDWFNIWTPAGNLNQPTGSTSSRWTPSGTSTRTMV